MNGDLVRGLTIPSDIGQRRRVEDCGTCRWAEGVGGESMICRGWGPMAQLFTAPAPPPRVGQIAIETPTTWPVVRRGHDYCRIWEKK